MRELTREEAEAVAGGQTTVVVTGIRPAFSIGGSGGVGFTGGTALMGALGMAGGTGVLDTVLEAMNMIRELWPSDADADAINQTATTIRNGVQDGSYTVVGSMFTTDQYGQRDSTVWVYRDRQGNRFFLTDVGMDGRFDSAQMVDSSGRRFLMTATGWALQE